MRFTELDLAGAYLLDIEQSEDSRGFFARTFCAREFLDRGLIPAIAQCSTSFNRRRGTLRGMHFQAHPYEEAKVVRCTSGKIFDVIVDLRCESATYTRWYGVELSSDNHRMLYVPPGFAHGFQTLEDNSEVFYQISVEYVASASRGIRWDDDVLGITWPIADELTISDRDAALPGIQG